MSEGVNNQDRGEELRSQAQTVERVNEPKGEAERVLLNRIDANDTSDPTESLKIIAGEGVENGKADSGKENNSGAEAHQSPDSAQALGEKMQDQKTHRRDKSIARRTRAVLAAGAIAAAASAVGANSAEAAGAFSSMDFNNGKQYEQVVGKQELPDTYRAVEAGYDKLKIDPLVEKGRKQLQNGLNELTGTMGPMAKITVDAAGGALIMSLLSRAGDNVNEKLREQLYDSLKSSGVSEASLIPLTKYDPDNMDFSHKVKIGEQGTFSFGASPLGSDKVVGFRVNINLP